MVMDLTSLISVIFRGTFCGDISPFRPLVMQGAIVDEKKEVQSNANKGVGCNCNVSLRVYLHSKEIRECASVMPIDTLCEGK